MASPITNLPKKSQDIGEHEYKLGDIVLAKVRGYPQWPGRLVDPETVPDLVARERPPSKKTKFYAVRFFPAGDYAWTLAKDLSLLQKHEIEAYINEPHKKSADLLKAYKIAMDPSTWEASLSAPDISTAEGDEEVDEEIDELDEGGDDGDSEKGAAKVGKKRKRESETKPRKKKDAGAKGPIADKKTPAKKKLNKKNGMRSKETIESEDDGGEADAATDEGGEHAKTDSSKKSAPPSKKLKKEKPEDDLSPQDPENIKVKEWRHKLQRGFLSKTIPKEEEMPEFDALFTTIENYNLTLPQLSFSKLGKVMRHITQLEPTKLQQEDKYQIRKRADALLEKWQKLVHIVKEEQQGQDATNITSIAPTEAVNGSTTLKPSDASGKNSKPRSANEKVAVSAEIPAIKPASQVKAHPTVTDLHATTNTSETTAVVTEQISTVAAETLVSAPAPATADAPGADDEQAMDMTDD